MILNRHAEQRSTLLEVFTQNDDKMTHEEFHKAFKDVKVHDLSEPVDLRIAFWQALALGLDDVEISFDSNSRIMYRAITPIGVKA